MNKQDKLEVLNVLQHIREDAVNGEIKNQHSGICINFATPYPRHLYDKLTLVSQELYVIRLMTKWPNGTGSDKYPIPGGREAFACWYKSKWKGEQLQYRLDLLNFLIDQTEADLIANHGWVK